MARYINPLTINRTENGKRYYNTVVPQNSRFSAFPREHTATQGDRWDTLAYRYFGNASLWYVLANANSGLNGSIFIKPGTIIKIPEV